jgi:hypothetical protein
MNEEIEVNEETTILSKWNELKSLVDSIEFDVEKNARGVIISGIRVRRTLRTLRIIATELVKISLDSDKLIKLNKLAKLDKE